MHPLTGSLEAPGRNGWKVPGGVGECVPPLQVEVKAADDDYGKVAYIFRRRWQGPTLIHVLNRRKNGIKG